MSMLTAQCERLRKVADDLDFYTITRDIHTASMLMREAADTIDELRMHCQELQEQKWWNNNQCERIRNQRKNLKEMQAALERKTCRMTLCAAGNDYARYTCSECERETMVPRVVGGVSCDYEPPRYCVNCGREVVE